MERRRRSSCLPSPLPSSLRPGPQPSRGGPGRALRPPRSPSPPTGASPDRRPAPRRPGGERAGPGACWSEQPPGAGPPGPTAPKSGRRRKTSLSRGGRTPPPAPSRGGGHVTPLGGRLTWLRGLSRSSGSAASPQQALWQRGGAWRQLDSGEVRS